MIPSTSNYLKRGSYISTGVREKVILSEGLRTMDFQSTLRRNLSEGPQTLDLLAEERMTLKHKSPGKVTLSEGLRTMDFQSAQRISSGLTQKVSGEK